ncbi:hypothetical protein HUT06_36430 [Actinomadura sp. NAK00032]|uniref:hypothetical protein n=1 Tax=Actinomadura sp. NAK00032 TaxID=2742128 RepID=UPI001590DD9D|nr:hypothetical protein [Actinomadura sp. NAK00032]QKW38836.1 hypothetical protein HUT06_36430 [Actinomadura sp. NAK00032]
MSESSPRTVTLRSVRDEKGLRHLSATRNAAGEIVLKGQDLGKGVSEVFGPDITEYEWEHLVAAPDAARLLRALGGGPGDDVLDLLPTGPGADVYGLLAEHEIEYRTLFSRLGD